MENIINEVTNIVKKACYQPSNIFGADIWDNHIRYVVTYAEKMADKLDANKDITILAALLHDYASILDGDLYPEHHIHGAVKAHELLVNYDIPLKDIEHIKDCILEHRGSVTLTKSSAESVCVASADAMAHIASIPSLLKLAYTKKGLNAIDGATWVHGKIQRSWNKLCPEAKEIMRDQYDSAMMVLAV